MKTLNDMVLSKCPWCGNLPTVTSCDRFITIGCNICKYHRTFHGLVQSEIDTGVPIHYNNGTISMTEWYDKDAYDRAEEGWNTRYG